MGLGGLPCLLSSGEVKSLVSGKSNHQLQGGLSMNLDEFLELSAVLTGVSAKELPADAKQQTTDGKPTTLGQIHLDRLASLLPC